MGSNVERNALSDTLRQIKFAQMFTEDLGEESFSADIMRVYAVTRCLEIISEASRRLSDALKTRHPGIPWREIASAGNVYHHQDVAAPRVWDTVQLALPQLRAAIASELGSESVP